MARKPDPHLIDDENPEWTEADFAAARPASDVLPSALYDTLTKRKPGQRGPGKRPAKVAVTLRLDPDVIEAFKAEGAGWQTRINDALRRAASGKRRQAS
jgi:uncharacterized protein (DUF4415 family)